MAFSMNLTIEQIDALAPDGNSLKAAQKLTQPDRWTGLGQSGDTIWGDCKGSASTPYLVQAELSEPAFKCTCPSRKFPCKHALGLLLLAVHQPEAVPQSEAPSRVADWLKSRAERAERAAKRGEAPPDPEAQAKRAARRHNRVLDGVEQLNLWLCDLVRSGLASLQAKGYGTWDTMAARMVDAQAPGLARQLRLMAAIPASGEGWTGRLLERISLLHLLLEAYQRIDTLPEATQADVRAAVGIPIRQEDILLGQGTIDQWIVLGRRIEEQDDLKTQRTWLWGADSAQPALILDFAYRGQTLDTSLIPGTAFEGEVVFYPSAAPLRAAVKSRQAIQTYSGTPPGSISIGDGVAAYANTIASNPWLELYPLAFQQVLPLPTDAGWVVADADRQSVLPLANTFSATWEMFAISGGYPIGLTSEWNGSTLLPLGLWADGRYVAL